MKQKGVLSKSEQGVSIVEILVVVLLVGLISAIVAGSLRSYVLYNADNQALKLVDLMREAQQGALTQKKTMRVEISSTGKTVRVINENASGSAADDTLVKTVNLTNSSYTENVFIGTTPSNMTTVPVEASPVTPVTFSSSFHPLSLGTQVATLRFMSNGTVKNAGTDAIGTNSTPTGATIFIWSKKDSDTSATPTIANVLRAVTVLSSSGSPRIWKCAVVSNQCSTWTR